MKANWAVRMRCVVTKEVYLQDCTEDEARNNPWDFAEDEIELEQIDWKVISLEKNK